MQGRITEEHSALAGNLFVIVSLLIGTIITGRFIFETYFNSKNSVNFIQFLIAFVKNDLRRQKILDQLKNSSISS